MLHNVMFLSNPMYLVLYNKYFLFFKMFFFFKKVFTRMFSQSVVGNTYYVFITTNTKLHYLIYGLQNFFGSQVNQLLDITAVDFLIQNTGRYVLYYWFLSTLYNVRYLIVCNLIDTVITPTISFFYNSAAWLEREIWDFFGIYFGGHSDLRRILTDYGFIGYPLRKDFPLSGYFELFYNDILKSVIYYKNNLAQEYRFYNFLIPWRKF